MTIRTLGLASTLVLALFTGCKKDDDDSPSGGSGGTGGTGGTGALTLASGVGVQMTFAGTAVTWNGTSGWDGYNSSSGGGSWSFGGGVTHFDTERTFNVELGTIPGDFHPTEAVFNAFFTTGARPYVAETNTTNGVRIEYWEGTMHWTTACESGSQTGSNFTITGVEAVNDQFNPYVKVLATFSCTLYPCSGTGASGNRTASGTIRANYYNI